MVLTLGAVWASVAWLALARPQDAVPVAGAAPRTALRELRRHGPIEGHLLRVPVIIVEAQEPVALLQVLGYCLGLQRGLGGTGRGLVRLLTYRHARYINSYYKLNSSKRY